MLNQKYVVDEIWLQGEVGPRFALSRMENLCHISQTFRELDAATFGPPTEGKS